MTTIESLENKLNVLTARFDSYAYKKFTKYQESIADKYDELDDKQMLSYYRTLIRKAEDLVYECNFDDVNDNADVEYITHLFR